MVIPFDLHDRGGMAGDCYITELSMTLPRAKDFVLPEVINFTEREHGCVDAELQISGQLHLTEQSEDYITYSSVDPRRCLMLFRQAFNPSMAYYFSEVPLEGVTAGNIEGLLSSYDEDAENANLHFPYRSSRLEQ